MVASGLLDGEPVELVDGLLVHVTPQGAEHAALVQRLTQHFAPRADLLRVQLPLGLANGRPEPDVALAETAGLRVHPATAALVVEIAVTSWADDQAKLPGYAAAGIPTAWLVDVAARRVHVYEQPGDAGYGAETVLGLGDTLSAPVTGVAALPVTDLFAGFDARGG
jgi:Uma2 family endonuclease